ncbi:MAG: imidazolonepropionase [Chloroflexi bacterium]|nr:MAG: imidazolonepropionase [Chloroflexota bacterium]
MEKQSVDLIIQNASQLVTCASPDGPKRGDAMHDVGIIENGAVAIREGVIIAVAETAVIQAQYHAAQTINATNQAVCPGFVDPHTHTIYGGDRAHEFELRIQGASYMEIMAAGGGIVSTMQHTRDASVAELTASAHKRLDDMLRLGTTTLEIKTGYGLNINTELKMLQVIEKLDKTHPCDLVPTFLGAHTLPPAYKDNPEGYVSLVINEMIPAVSTWYQNSHFAMKNTPIFIDVFCEDHAFTVEQTRRILQAGIRAGFRAKIHADQFNDLGSVPLAVELGAVSVDHLDVTSRENIRIIANSNTVATPLPAVNFNLGMNAYANGRAMIDEGAILALATDINPGSAPCLSLPMVMAIACRFQKLLPTEALNACTLNAAHAISLGHQFGSLEPGKQADILILKEADYRHLAYFFGHNPVAIVIKRGKIMA